MINSILPHLHVVLDDIEVKWVVVPDPEFRSREGERCHKTVHRLRHTVSTMRVEPPGSDELLDEADPLLQLTRILRPMHFLPNVSAPDDCHEVGVHPYGAIECKAQQIEDSGIQWPDRTLSL